MVKLPAHPKAKGVLVDQDAVVQLQSQVKDLYGKWCRAMADYQNLEKRTKEDRQELTKFLNAALIEKLLAVKDDLERAAAHLKDTGIDMIIAKFNQVMAGEGVQEINAQGQAFDPQVMNCEEMVDGSPNLVVSVSEKGYRIHGRLLRPAKVKVGKGGPPVSADRRATEDK